MKKYKIIYADPPWNYNDQGCRGTMTNHYKGMTISDLKSLPITEISDRHCALFIWATYPMLQEALELIRAWDFTYKTIAFQWIKTNSNSWGLFFGLGRWTRGNTEPCLLAIKGKPIRKSNNVSQIVMSSVMEHSHKPAIIREKIVQLMGDIPRIELFARRKVKGWDCWGNEVESDIIL